jgi:hypothetical protein
MRTLGKGGDAAPEDEPSLEELDALAAYVREQEARGR